MQMQATTKTPTMSSIEPRPRGRLMPEGKEGIAGGLWLGRVLGLLGRGEGLSRFWLGLCRRGASALFRGAPSGRWARRRRRARTVFLSGSEPRENRRPTASGCGEPEPDGEEVDRAGTGSGLMTRPKARRICMSSPHGKTGWRGPAPWQRYTLSRGGLFPRRGTRFRWRAWCGGHAREESELLHQPDYTA